METNETQSTVRNFSIASPDLIVEKEGLWQGRLFRFECLESTNLWVMANLGRCRHGDVIHAVHQTHGKGRLSRKWLSPPGRCLTFSICLDEMENLKIHPVLGQMTAIAVRNILEKYDIPCQLKWPNDLISHDKKIAGILAETDFSENRTVIGVGLNVNLTVENLYSYQLDQIATSMIIETENRIDIGKLLKSLISEIENMFDMFSKNDKKILPVEWGKYDWLMGSQIEIENRDRLITGSYKGLDSQGRLHIVEPSGHEHIFWTGDVRKLSKVTEIIS